MDSNNTFCIYLEYLPGGSIADLYKKCGVLGETRTRQYTKQILNALVYLHSKGVVHGDLKGANVLLTKEGSTCKLCDLGNSRFLDHDKSFKSVNSVISGTLAWMAPELYHSRTGKKSDVWSLGCLVIEMLTADNPWGKRLEVEGSSAVMALQRALEEK